MKNTNTGVKFANIEIYNCCTKYGLRIRIKSCELRVAIDLRDDSQHTACLNNSMTVGNDNFEPGVQEEAAVA